MILKKRLYQTLLSTFSQPIFVSQLDWSLDGTSSLAGEWKISLLKSALPTSGKGGHYHDFDAFIFKKSQHLERECCFLNMLQL